MKFIYAKDIFYIKFIIIIIKFYFIILLGYFKFKLKIFITLILILLSIDGNLTSIKIWIFSINSLILVNQSVKLRTRSNGNIRSNLYWQYLCGLFIRHFRKIRYFNSTNSSIKLRINL